MGLDPSCRSLSPGPCAVPESRADPHVAHSVHQTSTGHTHTWCLPWLVQDMSHEVCAPVGLRSTLHAVPLWLVWEHAAPTSAGLERSLRMAPPPQLLWGTCHIQCKSPAGVCSMCPRLARERVACAGFSM